VKAELSTLVAHLGQRALSETKIIPWGCPVPSFGDPEKSRIATLGLNPSNREFVDASGNELQGENRRFHTLKSLGLRDWSDAQSIHLRLILEACRRYFFKNPYDAWFKRLDRLISGANASYYDREAQACHLDLIPYATECKWTALTRTERTKLMAVAGDTLGLVLRQAPIDVLVLNGNAVVQNFEEIVDQPLVREEMPSWALPRSASAGVMGVGYTGYVTRVANVPLGRRILVLGFNHNIQSSFGVTTVVMDRIRSWISRMVRSVAYDAA